MDPKNDITNRKIVKIPGSRSIPPKLRATLQPGSNEGLKVANILNQRARSKLSTARANTASAYQNEEAIPTSSLTLNCPSKALEPKVFIPFVNPPGGIPRKIVIERKRRLYEQQNIEELLRNDHGIDYSKPINSQNKYENFLPLEVFDDTEFDERTQSEWMNLGFDEESESFKYVPARGVFFTNGRGVWHDCKVLQCNEQTNRYFVETSDEGEDQLRTWIPRVHLLFRAENPFNFAKRVAHAHKMRKQAESLLRYNLYIDNMPTDEISTLSDERVSYITQLALNTDPLREAQSYLPVNDFLNAIKQSYARTMNKIIFDKNMRTMPQKDQLMKFLALMPEESKYPVPELGVVKIPDYNYNEVKKQFLFNTYYTEPKIIDALLKVKGELLGKEKKKLFQLPMKKTVKLDEFEQIQQQSIEKLVTSLGDGWLKSVSIHIKSSLQNVGKGWLNVNETNRDIYNMGKLKKFMTAIRFMMEDALRFLMRDSLEEYSELIRRSCNFNVRTDSISEVKVEEVYEEDEDGMPAKPILPLFHIELAYDTSDFVYKTEPEKFVSALVQLFERAVKDMQKIPQVESMVLSNFFWSETLMLDTLKESDELIIEIREAIEANITKAIAPLKTYIQLFSGYKDLLVLNIQEYMKEYESVEHPLEEVMKDIQSRMTERDEILKSIPTKINLGTFIIDCISVRNHLSRKSHDIGRSIMTHLAKITKEKTSNITDTFLKISREINKAPQDIEQLSKLRTFMVTIPEITQKYEDNIEELKEYYEMLEHFRNSLSEEEFSLKNSAISWPKQLAEQVVKVDSFLLREKDSFRDRLLADQKIFAKELEAINKHVLTFSKLNDMHSIVEIANDVRAVQKQLRDCQERARVMNSKEMLFEMDVTEYDNLNKIMRQFQPYADLWITAHDWITWYDSWINDPFNTLAASQIQDDVKKAEMTINKCVNVFKEMPSILNIARTIQKRIGEFKTNVPLILSLRNPGMRERHWKEISKAIGMELIVGETINSLQDVFDLKLIDHIEQINKESEVAAKEYTIEKALIDMKNSWEELKFEIKPYRNTGTCIMKISDEVQQQLDDHIATTQTLGFSAFKKNFEAEIIQWESQLNLVSEIIDEWIQCQREWMALEPIFTAPEMIKSLPQLHKKFKGVDTKWRKHLELAHNNPFVMSFCTTTNGLLKSFKESNVALSQIQKGLNNYLETKRKLFARLYFLADEDLLEILAQAQEPRAVQPHLEKCFPDIEKLHFEDNDDMVAMYSKGGERVEFSEHVKPVGSVEVWLKEVEHMMQVSVKREITNALVDYSLIPRTQWVLKWPGQVIIVGSQFYWTKDVSQALESEGTKGLQRYLAVLKQQLLDITKIVSGNITPLQRTKLGALITIDVHARDVIETLIQQGVSSISDFEWVMQLRYYLEDEDIVVKQVESAYKYGYEYLGNTSRLVITPLTDKIYLTLTGALHLNLGGAPAGPAGTGKTETVKDLSKSLAKHCVVFNCQEGMNELSMAKFFKGLIMAGSWVCFDEFNRIDVEVLSVVAQQISTLQNAIRANLPQVEFDGTVVTVNKGFAVFITMNPGYAGRTELPDNLKALFRPVACMVPDYALIAEIRLFSFGFSDAKVLSMKMTQAFKLASEQLSSQSHYDFGMRAVNTVIAAAGLLKRDNPDMNEEMLLLRSLRDSNVPKFLANDVILFNGIISDLFPEAEQSDTDHSSLISSLQLAAKHFNIQLNPQFQQKCIQLYETTVLRHGLMLVGETGGGKTMCYRALAWAMTDQCKKHNNRFQKVEYTVLNPKSVKMHQLYGDFDRNTREWVPGVLATEFKKFADDKSDGRKWLIFDGPVDALWIETMNTVLDENKKLCLVSGAIISMSSTMNMVFEVEDLAVASPATVSRCGMVYLDPATCVPTEAHVQSWIDQMHNGILSYASEFQSLFELYLQPSLDYLRRQTLMKEYVPSVNGNLVTSCLNLLDSLFAEFDPKKQPAGLSKDEIAQKLLQVTHVIEPFFLFSIVWSVGATCDHNGRKLFDKFLRSKMSENKSQTPFPRDGFVYDYVFNTEAREWIHWMNTIPEFNLSPKLQFQDIIIPTIDSVRYTWLMDKLLTNDKHVLCVGPTGTAKSLIANEKVMRGMPDSYLPFLVYFSAQTDANQLQSIIDGRLEKHRKGVYGPPRGKKYITFIDDMNMPAREQYGAQPPIELLRQWMDHGGWYEYYTERLPFRSVVDLVVIAAMGPPGGGRNQVTNRFLRHFNFIAFPEMQDESLKMIFNTILETFAQANLSDEIQQITGSITEASIKLYNTIRSEMLPTPSKSHYTFNLRDLAKIFQGLLQAEKRKVTTIQGMVKLWCHESARVFRDRLINNMDRDEFDNILKKTLSQTLKVNVEEIIGQQRLIYTDFLSGGQQEKKPYEEVMKLEDLQRIMEEQLDYYNNCHDHHMNLVLFLDAIEHVCRIGRIIRQPGGNALLLGVGGSGRQSLTRLAAFMSEYTLLQVEITKSFDEKEWRTFLKSVLLTAGAKGENVVFLFTDTQILKESFLEDINNLLNAGDVPNLFENIDMEEIFTAMKPICAREKIPTLPIPMYSRFVKEVKRNLHIVLAMSPVGELFVNRLRMFPSLVNCCTIDWFSEWPHEALLSVSEAKIGSLDEPNISHVLDMCVFIHQSVADVLPEYFSETGRKSYVTPTSYLELLDTYNTLLVKNKNTLAVARGRLTAGMTTLKQTEEKVANLQEMLKEKQPVLMQTQQDIEENMKIIAVEKEEAAQTKAIVEEEEAAAQKKKDEAEAISKSAQDELDTILPQLDEAVKKVENLNVADINEVANYTTPTAGVLLVMEAVCVMFGKKATRVNKDGNVTYDWWITAKEMLSNQKKLKESMVNFEKEKMTSSTVQKVAKYINNEKFKPAIIKKIASKACVAMCEWVIAMYTFYFVNEAVQPKKEAYERAKEELAIVDANLAETKRKLQDVVDKIEALEADNRKALENQEKLSQEVEQCTVLLDRAERLIGGLAGEKIRWESTLELYGEQEKNMVGDMLINAGSVAYLGPFTAAFRARLETIWRDHLSALGINHTPSVDVRSLADPIVVRAWNNCGLPSDHLSIQNAIILSNARRWPLMIDPQLQANQWIKNMEKEKLKIVSPGQKDYLRTIMQCVQFGSPVLLENVGEELDPAIEPILLKQTFLQNNAPYMRFGEDVIPYNNDFKLYMTTKLRNPHYSPEASVKVTLLNFFITPGGLEDQLLGTVVKMETPELERLKVELMVKNAERKKELKNLQDSILQMLSENKGDILENEKLINALAESKVTSESIKEKVAEAEATEKEIDVTRNKYRPVATRGSLLFFCISDMANIDPMYQYSLQWFIKLFKQCIETSEESDELAIRLETLTNNFTYSLYNNVCQSLFENHKLLFSFILCIRILQGQDMIDPIEWRHFLTGGIASEEFSIKKPDAQWLSDQTWMNLLTMCKLPSFNGFVESFISAIDKFKVFFNHPHPHRERVPEMWEEKLSLFQKLVLLKCLRPDKVLEGISDFVTANLGPEFVKPPRFDLNRSFKDSSSVTPLVFILSSGADPKSELDKFADQMRVKKMESISLGRGTEQLATTAIRDGIMNGWWVLLQNCHLATSFMPELEQIVEKFSEENHSDFRLWLTSMPTPKFPVSILQNSVKVTLEPPRGLASNLQGSYDNFDNQFLEHPTKPKEFKKLLFGLCFFHAIIQERRKYGPLGWNIPYEFTSGDLKVCVQQLSLFLERYDHVPYKVIKFLTGQINYGGRVTDDWDRRTLMTIIEKFVNPEVLSDEYLFSSHLPEYRSIPAQEYSDYIEYLEGLPKVAHPEIFGLHENAEITYNTFELSSTTDTIIQMQPGGSGGSSGSGNTMDEIIENVATEILHKLPGVFDVTAVREKYPTKYSESMNTVIVQEVLRYNKLVSVVQGSLKDILKAIKGEVVMSKALERVGSSLFNNQVPEMWADVAYPSMMPLSAWVSDLIQRLKFIETWYQDGIPNVFWISGFFFPQGFLTGTLQNYARKKKYPIDEISFSFEVINKRENELTSPPEDGCFIKGLFLEGARWDADEGSLVESNSKELYTPLPILWLRPCRNRVQAGYNIYICPVYKTLRRAGTLSTTGHSTNFVLSIELPSKKPQEHWIRRGVATFCALTWASTIQY